MIKKDAFSCFIVTSGRLSGYAGLSCGLPEKRSSGRHGTWLRIRDSRVTTATAVCVVHSTGQENYGKHLKGGGYGD